MDNVKTCDHCRATVLVYAVEISERLCFLCKAVAEGEYTSHTIDAKDVACGVDYINEVRYHLGEGDTLTAMLILDLLQDIVTGERHCDSE